VNASISRRAGKAAGWRATQLGGVKLIYLARLLVLSRLLSPEDFGLVAIALVALDFVLSISNLGLEPALVQAREVRRAEYDTAWTLGLLRAAAVAVLLWVSAPLVAELFGEPAAAPLLRILALRPLLDAAASIRIARAVRELRLREISILRVVEATVNAGISVALAIPLGVIALAVGPVAGAAVYAIGSYLVVPWMPRVRLARDAVARLVGFGQWIFVSAAVAVAGSLLLQLGISRTLGAAALGTYFLAAKLAFLPSETVGGVASGVTLPVFALLQEDLPRATRAFRRLLIGMAAVVVPTALFLVVLAGPITDQLLGPKWAGTAWPIRLLALACIASLVSEVAIPLLQGIGRPRGAAGIEVVKYGLLAGLGWLGAASLGLAGAAAAWLPASTAAAGLAAVALRKRLPSPFGGTAAPLAGIAGASVLASGVALGLTAVLPGAVGAATGAVGFGASITAILVWLDRRFAFGLAADVARLWPATERFLGRTVAQ